MTGSDIILLPSSSTLETEQLGVAKDVVSSSSNLEVAKKDALETEKKPMDSEGGPKSAGTETEAKGERSQSKEKEVKDEGKDVHAKGSGTGDACRPAGVGITDASCKLLEQPVLALL